MFRRVALIPLVFVSLAVSATAAQAPSQQVVIPGVTVQRDVRFTPQGPVVLTVITAPKPEGVYSIVPELAHGTVSGGLAPLTEIQQDASGKALAAGINGVPFTSKGYPTGLVVQNGTMHHGALSTRSSIGFDANGTMRVKRVAFVGTWRGSGQRRPLKGVNRIPKAGEVILFTPAWGDATPPVANATEVVLRPFPAAAPNADLTAPVTAQNVGGGGATPIPGDGAVLMVKAAATTTPLQTDAPVGQSVTVRLILPSDWADVRNAVGGGPVLVKNGKPVFRTGENFDASDLAVRDARAGVGQLADGRVVLVAVDGKQPGFSTGISIFDLAKTMVSLGAVTAAALDSGASVTAASGGELLSRPKLVGGRALKGALLVEYVGVSAPAPSVALLDLDDVAAGEQLSYKVLRPSTVSASVVAPDGTATVLDSGARDPGTYSFLWSNVYTEGIWHWKVSATDDLGRASAVDQTFAYNLTLSDLAVPSQATRAAGVLARFDLSRPATVTLQIEAPGGTVVRTLPPQDLPAGAGSVRWDGTFDGVTKAPVASYVARVIATSEVGTMDLSAPFRLRG